MISFLMCKKKEEITSHHIATSSLLHFNYNYYYYNYYLIE